MKGKTLSLKTCRDIRVENTLKVCWINQLWCLLRCTSYALRIYSLRSSFTLLFSKSCCRSSKNSQKKCSPRLSHMRDSVAIPPRGSSDLSMCMRLACLGTFWLYTVVNLSILPWTSFLMGVPKVPNKSV